MNQENIGKIIKEIRKKNNLTQKDLADKYNVTYQAVSKWENGKNLPDIMLIKQMSKDFNFSLDEFFETDEKKNNKSKKIIYIVIGFIVTFLIIFLVIFFYINKDTDFDFKTLSSTCSDFNISGNIAYNSNKSAIYITNIQYCGGTDNEEYDKIECILYESENNIDKLISSYNYDGEEKIKLEDFLQQVTFAIDNYKNTCEDYHNHNLYLSIIATLDNKEIRYKIPLTMVDNCS